MMKKPMTAIQKFDAIQKIGTEVEVPFNVWTKFRENRRPISIVGTEICLGEDYCSIDQAREAVEWYVNQLGGTVNWKS
jgi:hypothetical protein